MKLYETPPSVIRVGRRKYKVDLDFRNVLKMMEVLDDANLLPEAASYLALKCVMKHPPRNTGDALKAVNELCFGKKKKEAKHGGQRLTSYTQDAALIRAAFLQTYGVDLWTAKLHWLQFRDLMEGLPTEGTRYAEIIEIRGRPMPKPTKYNADERKWLVEAKKAYAIELTEEEEADKYQTDVLNLFNGLMAMIPKESDNNG